MSLNTFNRAKLAQQFVPFDIRPGCGNCAYRSRYLTTDFTTERVNRSYQCMKGGFHVTALAICSEHQLRTLAATGAGE